MIIQQKSTEKWLYDEEFTPVGAVLHCRNYQNANPCGFVFVMLELRVKVFLERKLEMDSESSTLINVFHICQKQEIN